LCFTRLPWDFPALQRHSAQRPDDVGKAERDDALGPQQHGEHCPSQASAAGTLTSLLEVCCDSLAHLGQRWPRQWLRGLIGNSLCSQYITSTLMMYWVWRDDITADAETVSVRVNHLREMLVKLIRLESEGHLNAADLVDLTMQQLLDLRRELLAAGAQTAGTR